MLLKFFYNAVIKAKYVLCLTALISFFFLVDMLDIFIIPFCVPFVFTFFFPLTVFLLTLLAVAILNFGYYQQMHGNTGDLELLVLVVYMTQIVTHKLCCMKSKCRPTMLYICQQRPAFYFFTVYNYHARKPPHC